MNLTKTIFFILLFSFFLACNKQSDEVTIQKTTTEVNNPKGPEEQTQSKESNVSTKVYKTYEAAKHEGEFASVRGFVADVYFSEKAVFMNFEKKYPDHVFTAVVFKSDWSKFQNLNQYKGKYVKITGVIKIYKGKPEIILKSPEQIEIEK
jgi:hypothetical protein